MGDQPTMGGRIETETDVTPLRGLREERGLSRAQLAAAANVPEGTIISYELKGVDPSLTRAAALAAALGVSVDALAGRGAAASTSCAIRSCGPTRPLSA